MASFNRVILMGNITRDIELRYVGSGIAVTDVGLAVNDRRKNANGEWVEETTFVDITPVMEQKLAAMAEMKAQQYLQTYYTQRADQRGNHARRSSGNQDIRQAEAFQRVTPNVVGAL